MTFIDYLQDNASLVEQELSQILEQWQQEFTATSDNLTHLAEAFIDSSTGGKYLRAGLVRLGYKLQSGQDNPEVLKSAVAIEIFQTAILAHDDIIDKSLTRRGRPTLYRQLGGDHYAISQAICLGDGGLFLGCKLIADSDFPEGYKNKAVSIFCQMMISTVYGEMLDVELPRLKVKTESDVLTIHRLKTAYYTIVYPLSIGATLAGGDDQLLQKLQLFGENLGIAFQIQDDILGVFGDEKTLGKSVTSDIEEGKNTTLITTALEKANDQQKELLTSLYGNGPVTTEQLEQIKKVFEDTGALDYSRQLAVQYVNQAKQVIPQITKDSEMAALLTEMADFLVQRNK